MISSTENRANAWWGLGIRNYIGESISFNAKDVGPGEKKKMDSQNGHIRDRWVFGNFQSWHGPHCKYCVVTEKITFFCIITNLHLSPFFFLSLFFFPLLFGNRLTIFFPQSQKGTMDFEPTPIPTPIRESEESRKALAILGATEGNLRLISIQYPSQECFWRSTIRNAVVVCSLQSYNVRLLHTLSLMPRDTSTTCF